jgi:hypothetical protein
MKKIVLSLAALAALSTASFAERTDIDPRDRNWAQSGVSASATVSSALAADETAMTNFERLIARSVANEDSRNN